MSTTEYKVVLRTRLPDVKTDKEHLEWFQANVGQPSATEVHGKRIWFSYDQDSCYAPMDRGPKPYFDPCFRKGVYGVELVFAHSKDDAENFKMTLSELVQWEEKLKSMPGTSNNILLLSYGWYNGVDEPIEWE